MKLRFNLALTLSVLLLISVPAHSQQPKAIVLPTESGGPGCTTEEVTALKDENATLRIQIANLKFAMLQGQATPIVSDKQKAIQELVAAHPGMQWSDAQNKLVPTPKPAEAPNKPAAK